MCVYMYMYIYIYNIYMYVCIYIHIYKAGVEQRRQDRLALQELVEPPPPAWCLSNMIYYMYSLFLVETYTSRLVRWMISLIRGVMGDCQMTECTEFNHERLSNEFPLIVASRASGRWPASSASPGHPWGRRRRSPCRRAAERSGSRRACSRGFYFYFYFYYY